MFRRRHNASPAVAGVEPVSDGRWELISHAIDEVPVGLVVEDARGQTVISNRRARSPLGDLAGDTMAEVALQRAVGRARHGTPSEETVNIAGTRPRRLEVTARPLPAGGAVGVLVDTTDRLRLDAVRRDFVANVNHELRTPIGALAVLAEALAGERDPATVDRLAGRIQAEAERARILIEDLLEFSRVEAPDQPQPRPLPVAELAKLATTRVAARAEEFDVAVEVNVESDAWLFGDLEQLAVAVTNLLDNAIKYSNEGDVVTITAAATEAGAVDIVVRDHGIGIPARDLDRIFERFYRVDIARDRRTGGTGLGLAIVRHVAANHAGDVFVESSEGVGSTFTLRLPALDRP